MRLWNSPLKMASTTSRTANQYPVIINPIVAFLLFLGTSGIGLELSAWGDLPPLVWPAAGVALVILLIGGLRLVPVVFLSAMVARLLEGGGILDSLFFGAAYSLTASLTLVVLRKYGHFRPSMERIIDVSWFIVPGVFIFPLLSALITGTAIWFLTPHGFDDLILLIAVRWLGDALGIMVVTPFLLVWYSKTRINWRNEQSMEFVVWVAVMLVIGLLVFRNWAPTDTLRYPLELTLFPVMAWAAIRFGQRGVTFGIFLVSLIASWELRHATGPDAVYNLTQPPGYLWVFVGIISITSLFLAATWTELYEREKFHQNNADRLQLAKTGLEERDQLLRALTRAEGALLKESYFEKGLQTAMKCIGEGVKLDLIHLYRLHFGSNGQIDCTHSWSSAMGRSFLLTSGMLDSIREDWLTGLKSGKLMEIHASDDIGTGAEVLNEAGLKSIVVFGISPVGGDPGLLLYGAARSSIAQNEHALSVLETVSQSIQAYLETHLSRLELERAKDKAESADRAKSEFLATMSHEIRTPMNAILGFSQLLSQYDLEETQQEYIRIIQTSGQNLMELINNILDFSNLESDSIDLEHVSFSLADTVRNALEMVHWQAREKALVIEFNVSEELNDCFIGDPHRIRQVLLNLLTNAIKFTNKGKVELQAYPVAGEGNRLFVAFSISDTGIGVPAGKFTVLFDPFKQLDSSTTREFGGSGLGLSIVLKLVDKMGGAVTLQSTEGSGSIFTVYLPLEKSGQRSITGESGGHVSQYEGFADAHPLRILVVEDDNHNIRLINQVLNQLGYSIETVRDGIGAMRQVSENHFDVVCVDMHMTRLAGMETARCMRKGDCGRAAQEVPIIAMSALDIAEERERILQVGIDYYLPKPVSLASFSKLLKEIFQKTKKTGPA